MHLDCLSSSNFPDDERHHDHHPHQQLAWVRNHKVRNLVWYIGSRSLLSQDRKEVLRIGSVRWGRRKVVECTSTFLCHKKRTFLFVTITVLYIQFSRQQFALFLNCYLLHTRHHRASWTLSQKAGNNKDQDLPGMFMFFFHLEEVTCLFGRLSFFTINRWLLFCFQL